MENQTKEHSLMDKIKALAKGVALIFVIGGLSQYFLPWWWIIVPVAALVGYFLGQTAGQSYAYGFIAVLLLWSIMAGYLSNANGGVLSGRIADLLGNGKISGLQLIFLTGIIGGILGGFGAMTGAMLKDLLRKEHVHIAG